MKNPEVYCVCGCGTKRPESKMYHYGVPQDDGTYLLVGPVVKLHKLKEHQDG